MNWWQALILGIVEGITEYLPISSTGHLLLTQRLLGISADTSANAFAISIQAGAILAVFSLYFYRIRQITLGILGKNLEGFWLGLHLFVAFLPSVFFGLFFEKPIKHYFFGGHEFGLWPIVAAWLLGGLAILALSFWRRQQKHSFSSKHDLENLTLPISCTIGLFQCIALWPGISRSLVTIAGGLLAGLSLASALEFSFLLGLLTLGAATLYEGLKNGKEMLHTYGTSPLLIGFIAAWISALLAVKWMVRYLNRHGLAFFGWYRIILALFVASLLLGGFL